MKNFTAVLTVALLTSAAWSSEGSLPWPQFRGPNGSGVAEEGQRPPVEIGPEKNVRWKVAIPSGASSPCIVGDLIALTAFDDGKLYTIAYNRADGRELWRAEAPAKEIEKFHATEGSPAASTCATDGKRIVSYFGSCGLFCYDLAGHEQWKLEMPVAKTLADFGTGVSPIIVDGLVVLVRDEATDPKIVALDLATGKIRWEKPRQSKSGFCTPVVWDEASGKQLVVAGFGQLIGYGLAKGDDIWHVDGMPASCCASPVAARGEVFFAGWSPGDPGDSDFKMPTFDQLLKQGDTNNDTNGDGMLSKEEAANTPFKNFFDNNDQNKDGQITREEWNGMLDFIGKSKNSAFAVKAGGTGDITGSHVAWKQTKGLPYVSSAILYQGQYLMVKDGGIVTAYDEQTGDLLYSKRAIPAGGYYASPIAADGHIYFAALGDGAITVLKAGATAPETVAENPPLGERVSATPAIADDTLYVRTAGHLYAFAAKN